MSALIIFWHQRISRWFYVWRVAYLVVGPKIRQRLCYMIWRTLFVLPVSSRTCSSYWRYTLCQTWGDPPPSLRYIAMLTWVLGVWRFAIPCSLHLLGWSGNHCRTGGSRRSSSPLLCRDAHTLNAHFQQHCLSWFEKELSPNCALSFYHVPLLSNLKCSVSCTRFSHIYRCWYEWWNYMIGIEADSDINVQRCCIRSQDNCL